jgi:hypothetical protein
MTPRVVVRGNWWGAALLVFVFLAGTAVGAAVISSRTTDTPAPVPELDASGHESFTALNLTSVQREAVDSILAAMAVETDSFLGGVREAFTGIADGAQGRIRQVLEPGQVEVFDSLLAAGRGFQMRVIRRTPGTDTDSTDQ